MTRRQELVETTWYTSLGCWVAILVTALIAVGAFLYLAYAQGWIISQHVKNIRHSIGYVDAQNAVCRSDMRDWASPTASVGQKRYLVNDCRGAISTLTPDEVASDVQQWLQENQ